MPDSKMLTEIYQQPDVLERILDEGWAEILAGARTLRRGRLRSVMIAARGTSNNAALYAKYLFEILLGVPTALVSPSAFTLYKSEMDLRDTLVIGISQSGESNDVLESVRRCKESGATTLTITNDMDSSMAGVADGHLFLRAGKEESIAATKTYTAELLVLYLLAAALRGEETPGEQVRGLPVLLREVLEVGWEGVERYRYAEYMVVTSRGYNLSTAKEAALKLMETTYTVAQAFSAADFEHGPIAMVGRDFPVVVVAPAGKVQKDLRALVGDLGSRGAEFVAISDDSVVLGQASSRFEVPVECAEELAPILYAAPIQLFAERLAVLKGLDPDSPRGLSKVTETW